MCRACQYKWHPYYQADAKNYHSKLDEFCYDSEPIAFIISENSSNQPCKKGECVINCHLFAVDGDGEENATDVVASIHEEIKGC